MSLNQRLRYEFNSIKLIFQDLHDWSVLQDHDGVKVKKMYIVDIHQKDGKKFYRNIYV